jgi:hypothetical protein
MPKRRYISREALIVRHHHNLDEVVKLICLDRGCLHQIIGNVTGNPYLAPSSLPCGNACPICRNEFNNVFLPVARNTLTAWMVEYFFANGRTRLLPDFVNAMKNAPNAVHLFYGGKDGNKTPPTMYFIHATILQMIAAGFLELRVESKDGRCHVTVHITLDATKVSVKMVTDDATWGSIHTVDSFICSNNQ